MFNRIKVKLSFLLYDLLTRRVFSLPPLETDKTASFAVASMLCKRDLNQYLVALYSMFRYVRPRAVYILNDGSLNSGEIEKIHRACPSAIIKHIADFRTPGLPIGGCWERITAIAELSKDEYIIQLDADTIFLKNPVDMTEAVNAGRSFALPTDSGTHVTSAERSIRFAQSRQKEGIDHIQIDAEASLDIMGDIATIKYIRACAGFAGYAPKTLSLEKLLNVSSKFQEKFGDRWNDWGTEQFTSNYLLANTEDLSVLPITKYDSVDKYKNDLTFVHFIGCYRFDKGIYFKESRQLIRKVLTETA